VYLSARVTTPTPAPAADLRRAALAGVAWMLLAQALFAGMNVATRAGAAHLPWPEVAAARFAVGALVAFLVGRMRGTSLRVVDRRNTWFRTIFGTLSALGTFYALASPRVSLGDAVTLGATAPIFVALLSRRVIGERVGVHVGLAMVLGFAGVATVVRPSFDTAAPVAAAATMAAVTYALAMLWLRKIGPDESSEAIVLHYSLFATVVLLAVALPHLRMPDARGAFFLVLTGVCGGGAQVAMTRAYALARAAPLSALTYVGIVFTHLLAFAAFGDRPDAWQILGALLVISAGFVLVGGAALPSREKAAASGLS
jgi:drug/metabolite transporter (DMT)-like permease